LGTPSNSPEPVSDLRLRVGSFVRIWTERPWGTLLVVLLAGLAITIVLDAWVCDDAYILFRVVDNAIHGHGLVFNVGERVQAYTDPLFMLAMVFFSFFTREVYFTGLVVSILASLGAVAVLVGRVSRSTISSVAAVAILLFSGSFISYATSGLENCFVFLLSALFFWKYFERDRYDSRSLLVLTALFSLAVVNRVDTGLLLAPALAFAYFRREAATTLPGLLKAAVAGLVPLAAWEAFSLVYYGFLFPNTAYAKLNTGIPSAEYLVRGVWYYIMSTLQDPITLAAILVVSALVLFVRRAKTSVPLIGVGLYLVYVLKIGDFMRGRFFTAPLFIVMLVFVSVESVEWERVKVTSSHLLLGAAVLVLVQNLGLLTFNAMDLNQFRPYGVYNDKAIYFPSTNLPMNLLGPHLRKSPLVQKGESMRREGETPVVWATLGLTGYYAGPKVHIVDPLALNDALLARMPAIEDPEWRSGHLVRYIPDGYLDTIRTGRNEIEDPNLAEYYDSLSLVIKGPIWSRERWRAIWKLNTGKLDHLIDRDYYRYEVEPQLDIDAL